MLSASRALRLNAHSAPPLPQVPELAPLYKWGVTIRQGELVMIAGRSGSQKSGFALFLVAQMNLPTLYFSADMSPYEATTRLAAMKTRETGAAIEARISAGGESKYVDALKNSNVTFAFGQPLTWDAVTSNLEAWVEMHNEYPPVIVIDNLMDIEGCEGSYELQTQAMQDLSSLTRDTGSTVMVLHHGTESGVIDPTLPPSRVQILNKLSQKPQLILTVALAAQIGCELRIACVKQRSGKSDPSAQQYIRLRAMPEYTRFEPGPAEWNNFY